MTVFPTHDTSNSKILQHTSLVFSITRDLSPNKALSLVCIFFCCWSKISSISLTLVSNSYIRKHKNYQISDTKTRVESIISHLVNSTLYFVKLLIVSIDKFNWLIDYDQVSTIPALFTTRTINLQTRGSVDLVCVAHLSFCFEKTL